MKLRLTKGEIRIRLDSAELNDFAVLGRIEEEVNLGEVEFRFALEKAEVPEPDAELAGNNLTVRLPRDSVNRWTASDLIGIESDRETGDMPLRILVEKDLGRRSSHLRKSD